MWKSILVLLTAFTTSLSAEISVLAFSGSTRADSLNQKLVTEAANLAKQMGATVKVVSLSDYAVPLYDADLEARDGMPLKAKEFRRLMLNAQVIMISSPEYNGSLSAVLKNIIDWSSRSEEGGGSRDAFKGKKFVIMSASPGGGGGARGLPHLRTILENVGGTVVPNQLVLPNATNAFDEAGHLKNGATLTELKKLVKTALN